MKKFKKIYAIVCLVMICNIFMSALPISDFSRDTEIIKPPDENLIIKQGNHELTTFDVYSKSGQNLSVYKDGRKITFKEMTTHKGSPIFKYVLHTDPSGVHVYKYQFHINNAELDDEGVYSFHINDLKCEMTVLIIPME